MKNQIPDFLQEKLKLTKSCASKFPDDIKAFLISYAVFYDWPSTLKLQTIFRLIKMNISNLDKCGLDGCNNKIRLVNKYPYFSVGCCMQHSLAITNIKKYGVENIMQCDFGKKKLKKSMLKKYGVENPTQNKEILDKIKRTNLEKYGVEWNINSDQSIIKQKRTMKEKYGVEFAQQSLEIQEKTKNTNLLRYGHEFVGQVDKFIIKKENTNLIKYGHKHQMHNSLIAEKALVNAFKLKAYKWNNGEFSFIQGYEDKALKELELIGYTFDDVITSSVNMPEILYYFEGVKHRYYPDFYIPSENKIVEVKSEYTLIADWDKNQAKFEATRNLGFDFILKVY